jgi:ABC-type phosphate/phosphonate transport system substrate-binding protein
MAPGLSLVMVALGEGLGLPTALRPVKTYAGIMAALDDEDADIVLLPPFTFVEARRRHPGLRPLARPVLRGSSAYSAFILVRSEDPFRDLTELRGRRFTFVDRHSASGFLYAYDALLQAGVEPSTDLRLGALAGSHEEARRLLVDAETDAIATWSTDLPASEPAGEGERAPGLRILAKVGRLPHDVVAARPTLSPELGDALVRVLRSLHTQSPAGLKIFQRTDTITGWTPASEEDYAEIEATWDRVRAHLAQHPVEFPPLRGAQPEPPR